MHTPLRARNRIKALETENAQLRKQVKQFDDAYRGELLKRLDREQVAEEFASALHKLCPKLFERDP